MKKSMNISQLIEKSASELEDSGAALSANRYNMSVNRSYYSMFHIASAAVTQYLGAEVKNSPKHEYFLGMLNKELAHPGLIDAAIAKSINKASYARELADYTDAKFDESEALQFFEMAKKFHQEITRFIESGVTKKFPETTANFNSLSGATNTLPKKKFSESIKGITENPNTKSGDEYET
jgi:uncharacterized protein (UPF0332 family)